MTRVTKNYYLFKINPGDMKCWIFVLVATFVFIASMTFVMKFLESGLYKEDFKNLEYRIEDLKEDLQKHSEYQ